jgi:xylose isomerase
LKERALAFRADPEVQAAMAASGIAELAQPTLAPGESVADLLADDGAFETYDADKSGEHSYAFVHLNQLAVEHALGGR